MQSFIDLLKKQDNKLLKNESSGIELFKSLKHNKEDLDKFLKYTVAEILTSSKKILICTSNEELVKKFSPIKQLGISLQRTIRVPFKTSHNHNVFTWDLVKNKYASIAGSDWQIINFIVINKSNVEILHRSIVDLLKKVR